MLSATLQKTPTQRFGFRRPTDVSARLPTQTVRYWQPLLQCQYRKTVQSARLSTCSRHPNGSLHDLKVSKTSANTEATHFYLVFFVILTIYSRPPPHEYGCKKLSERRRHSRHPRNRLTANALAVVAILPCKTGCPAGQNSPYRNAKRATLQIKAARLEVMKRRL